MSTEISARPAAAPTERPSGVWHGADDTIGRKIEMKAAPKKELIRLPSPLDDDH